MTPDTPLSDHILDVLALAFEPTSRTTLRMILNSAGSRAAKGTQRTAAAVAEALKSLLETDQVEEIGRQLTVSTATFERRCRVCQRDGSYAAIAAAVGLHNGPMRYHQLVDLKTLLWARDFRRALVTGDRDAVEQLADRFNPGPKEPKANIAPWFVDPLQPKAIRALPPIIRQQLLQQLTRKHLREVKRIPGLVELLEDLAEEDTLLRPILARHRLLSGALHDALSLVAGLETAPLFEGCVAFMRGDVKRATSQFARGLTFARRQRAGVAGALLDIEGIWAPMTYLLHGTTSRRKQAEKLMDHRFPTVATPSEMRFFEASLYRLDSLVAGEAISPALRPKPNAHPVALLLHSLLSRWIDADVDHDALTAAELDCEKAGLHWLAGELAAVRYNDPSWSCSEAKALLSLRQPTTPWQRQLDGLEDLLAREQSSKTKRLSSKRVSWRIQVPEKRAWIELSARVQSCNAKGGWSVGKPVANERLMTNSQELPGVTAQDVRIAAALSSEVSHSWRGYPEVEYHWDQQQAWRALVDHPNVVRADDPTQPVQITGRRPQLHVVGGPDGLRMRLDPPAPAEFEDDLLVTAISPSHYEVIDFGLLGAQLGRMIGQSGGGKSYLIPTSGNDRVGSLLKRLMDVFEIVDHVAVAHATRTESGVVTPMVLLAPEGMGAVVQVVVEPLPGRAMPAGEGVAALLVQEGGETIRIERNLSAEEAALERVLRAATALRVVDPHEIARNGVTLPNPEAVLTLLADLQPLVNSGDAIVRWPQGQQLRLRSPIAHKSLAMTARADGDWFAITGTLKLAGSDAFAERTLDLAALLELAASTAGRFVDLGQGEFAELTASLRRQLDALARVGARHKAGVRVHRLATEVAEPLFDDANRRRTDAAWKKQLTLRDAPPAALPRELAADLRPYQLEGYEWLTRMAAWGAGCCLADDMGLGKTLQTLALLLQRGSEGPALVVAPTSVCGGWQREAWRFAPTLQMRRLGGADRAANRATALADLGPNVVVIVSYGLLVSEQERLSAVAWSTVVLDEAQAIKNPTTRRFKAAAALQAGHRVALTGTPIENHISELWALMTFLNPGLLGPKDRFLRRYAAPLESGDRVVAAQLRKLVRPFLLRRTKAAVLDDLPAKIEHTVLVEPNLDEAAFYEALRQRAVEKLQASDGQAKPLQVLAELSRLRLACCHPKLALKPEESALAVPESAKLAAFGELIEGLLASRQRALVFSQFVKHLNILRAWLDANNHPYLLLTGSTPALERDRLVAAFQAGEAPLFLISLRAGGTGLNLTAADAVLHMDPWWNPAVEDQATDRAHRIGRTRPVTVYRLIMQGTVEERIVALHRSKRDLADRLLADADAAVRLGAKELMALMGVG